jgi:hypothetical protein
MVEISFGSLGSGDFKSQPSCSPRMILAGVHRFLPRVLLESTILVHFRTSAFGSSGLCPSNFDPSTLRLFMTLALRPFATSSFMTLALHNFASFRTSELLSFVGGETPEVNLLE